MFESVLVICVGNICRSAVGERLLSEKIVAQGSSIVVGSAGIGALVGQTPDPVASDVAALHGLSLSGHVARQFTPEMGKKHSLLLVLEPGHRQHISRLAPELSGRIMLFDQWTGARGISDPYRRSREFHETVYRRLDEAATAWSQRLTGRKEHPV